MKTALQQIRRTPYQALLATMVLSMTFFAVSIFVLISIGFHIILNHFASSPQVIAFFEKGKDLSDQDISRIKTRLEATGKLDSFKYVSTRDAEKIYKDNNKDDPLLNDLVDYKILPPSIEISATDISDLSELKEILDSEPLVKDLIFYEDVVNKLTTWVSNLRLLGLSMIGFLVFLSVLILMVIIGLKIKNKGAEIEIMRLLGASGWYIHGPFLLEGMFYGGLGAFFGWLASFTVLQYSTPILIIWLDGIIKLPVDIYLLLIFLAAMMLGGMILGAFGSLLAVRRFIKI